MLQISHPPSSILIQLNPIYLTDPLYLSHWVSVSAIYDINLQSPVKPYVGARVGLNRVSFDTTEYSSNFIERYETRKTKTGLGVMTGIGYDINQNIALDAGYRYNHWGKFDGVKVHTHEVSAGVRVKY